TFAGPPAASGPGGPRAVLGRPVPFFENPWKKPNGPGVQSGPFKWDSACGTRRGATPPVIRAATPRDPFPPMSIVVGSNGLRGDPSPGGTRQARGRLLNTVHAGFFTPLTVSRPDCHPVICGWSRT